MVRMNFKHLICLSTNKLDVIDEDLIINIKGKKIMIKFLEVTDMNYLKNRIAPMSEDGSQDLKDEEIRMYNEKADLGERVMDNSKEKNLRNWS